MIEVALFMSILSDVAGTCEDRRKGTAPKGWEPCSPIPWAWSEQFHDCHRKMVRYPKNS